MVWVSVITILSWGKRGNLLWRAWAVVLGIQFYFLKQTKTQKRSVDEKKWGKEGKNKQLRVWILTCMIAAEKKPQQIWRKEKDIACGFIICFKIWQKCVNVKAFKVLLSTSFLVTGSEQYCQKSVLAGKVRLFSNRKKD